MVNSSSVDVLKVNHNKLSVLNSISLNTPRNRMSELFNDFKQLNVIGSTTSLSNNPLSKDQKQKSFNEIKSSQTDESFGNGSSIELVKVVIAKPKTLSTLYVGDLDATVTEEVLYNHFLHYTSLSSVKICYAPNSRKSLGYGYVNFENQNEAKQALDELNYTLLLNKEIRIMEALQGKDKILGTNVFISNLDTSGLTTRIFFDKFKKYGSILSCKLDFQKRQGFISFENKLDAEKLVKILNCSLLDGQKIFCGIHIPKSVRKDKSQPWKSVKDTSQKDLDLNKTGSSSTLDTVVHKPEYLKNSPTVASIPDSLTSNNFISDPTSCSNETFKQIYIKGLPLECSEMEVLKLFSSCGKIVDVFLSSVPQYKSSWCLVTFDASESAINAVEAYHKTLYKGRRLTCVKALKKADRQNQLINNAGLSPVSRNFRENKLKRSNSVIQKSQTYKLYLYNLPEGLNENFFKLFLQKYTFQGKILRYSINNPNNLKNYSYIEFEKESDAKDVNVKLNGINVCGYLLVSALEKKDLGSSPVVKRTSSVYQELDEPQYKQTACLPAQSFQRTNSDYCGTHLANPSFIGVSPTSFQSYPHHQQTQYPLVGKVAPYDPRRFSHGPLSRSPSIKDHLLKSPGVNSESTFFKLKEYALRNIDFLIYPSATRTNNLNRLVQYILDTSWNNDSQKVQEFLKASEFDPYVQNAFKEKLVETIKLFGFER